jgi:hypothetical protein
METKNLTDAAIKLDPVQTLNNECLLHILDYLGEEQEQESQLPFAPTVDFLDTIPPNDSHRLTSWQVAKLYCRLSILSKDWTDLLGRWMRRLATVGVEYKHLRGKSTTTPDTVRLFQLMESYGVPTRSLSLDLICDKGETVWDLHGRKNDYSQVVEARFLVEQTFLYLGLGEFDGYTPELAKLQLVLPLHTRTFYIMHEVFATFAQFWDLRTLHSVDLVIVDAGILGGYRRLGTSYHDEFYIFVSQMVENIKSVKNLRLYCDILYPFEESGAVLLKIRSPTLEKLSLEYFRPFTLTRFELEECPNLMECTCSAPSKAIVSDAMQEDPRCLWV